MSYKKVYNYSWEQRKLGSIASSYSGGTPTAGKAECYDGDIPFIRSGEINEEKTELFLSELGYKNSSAAMVEKGDILYALYGATSDEVSIARQLIITLVLITHIRFFHSNQSSV